MLAELDQEEFVYLFKKVGNRPVRCPECKHLTHLHKETFEHGMGFNMHCQIPVCRCMIPVQELERQDR